MAPPQFVVVASRHGDSGRRCRRHEHWDRWAHSCCAFPLGIMRSNWNDTDKISMAPAQFPRVLLG